MQRVSLVTRWQYAVEDDQALAAPVRHVLIALSRYADWDTGLHARPGTETLARKTGWSRSTITRALAAGIERGYLVRVNAPRSRHGRYGSEAAEFALVPPKPTAQREPLVSRTNGSHSTDQRLTQHQPTAHSEHPPSQDLFKTSLSPSVVNSPGPPPDAERETTPGPELTPEQRAVARLLRLPADHPKLGSVAALIADHKPRTPVAWLTTCHTNGNLADLLEETHARRAAHTGRARRAAADTCEHGVRHGLTIPGQCIQCTERQETGDA
jgi:hypothetical protein